MANTSQGQSADDDRGEGFAYFRWHSLTWPYPCHCEYAPDMICYRCWNRILGYDR